MAQLLYGSGLRLLECLRLRIKDLDFGYHQVTVRDSKGLRERRTLLPARLERPLRDHLAGVREIHKADLARGGGAVYLPFALSGNIQTRRGTGAGSGSFRQANFQLIRVLARHAVTTCMKRTCKTRLSRLFMRLAYQMPPVATPFAIVLLLICSKPATIFVPSKNYSDTATSRRQ